MKFVHKDKEFFDAVCTLFPSFKKRFQEACEDQFDDDSLAVAVNRRGDEDFFWHIEIPKTDIEIIEAKPYKWYPREYFDGNPNNYILLEHDESPFPTMSVSGRSARCLGDDTKWFMYIEPVEE